MKKLLFTMLCFHLFVLVAFAQETVWERLSERYFDIADRLAEQAGYYSDQAELIAEQLERRAGILENYFENKAADWEERYRGTKIDFESLRDVFQEQPNRTMRGYLGIYTERISGEKATKLSLDNQYGGYVTRVQKNSLAGKAGIKPLDYIYGIDEYRVGEKQSLDGILSNYQPGDEVEVHFFRKGERHTVKVVLDNWSLDPTENLNDCERSFLGINQIGNIRQEGVVVRPVSGSTAEDLGLIEGDKILTVNGYQMLDWRDVSASLSALKPGDEIVVEYERDGKIFKNSKPIRSYAETKNCPDCDCYDRQNFISRYPGVEGYRTERRTDRVSSQPPTFEKLAISLDEVSVDDVESLKKRGIEIPSQNTLLAEDVQISKDLEANKLSLRFRLSGSGRTQIYIFNESGRSIYHYDLGSFSGQFEDMIELALNGVGNYFLKLTQDDKTFSKKIILKEN